MIRSIYGITRADGEAFDCLVYYIHRLNPEIVNVNSSLGPLVVRTIDLQAFSFSDLIAEDREAVVNELQKKFKVNEIVYQTLNRHLPVMPEDIEVFRILVGLIAYHSDEISTASNVSGGLISAGEMVTNELKEEFTKLKAINHRMIYFLDAPGPINQLRDEANRIRKRVMQRLLYLERFAFVGDAERRRIAGRMDHGIVAPRNLTAFLKHLNAVGRFYKNGAGFLTVLGVLQVCATISKAPADQRRKVFAQEMAGMGGAMLVGVIGMKMVTMVWKNTPAGAILGLGLIPVTSDMGADGAKALASILVDEFPKVFNRGEIDFLIQHCK